MLRTVTTGGIFYTSVGVTKILQCFIADHQVKWCNWVSTAVQKWKVRITSKLAVGGYGSVWSCREGSSQSIMYCNVPPLLLVARLRFLVIVLLFDFFPLNQIDQDIHTKYTLSSDAELILIRSLTLGKVTGKSSSARETVVKLPAHPPIVLLC